VALSLAFWFLSCEFPNAFLGPKRVSDSVGRVHRTRQEDFSRVNVGDALIATAHHAPSTPDETVVSDVYLAIFSVAPMDYADNALPLRARRALPLSGAGSRRSDGLDVLCPRALRSLPLVE
jgi:predicted metal-dependent HD superfamily phosphohydrolase